jgi:hypothetical protein
MARLWIEDSYRRLTRNGFGTDATFARIARPGVGVVLAPSVLGDAKVSSRRGVPILSVENSWLARQMRYADQQARVRISVNHIVLMPRLRAFHVGTKAHDCAEISGMFIRFGERNESLETARPAMHGLIGELRAVLDWQNLVLATEIMGDSRPERVFLSGDPLCVRLAGKFLEDGAYTQQSPGEYRAA